MSALQKILLAEAAKHDLRSVNGAREFLKFAQGWGLVGVTDGTTRYDVSQLPESVVCMAVEQVLRGIKKKVKTTIHVGAPPDGVTR